MGLRWGTVTVNGVAKSTSIVPNVKFGTISVSGLAGQRASRSFINSVTVHMLGHRPPLSSSPDPSSDHLYAGTVCVHVLATRTPLFDWKEMLYYDVFPKDIGYQSIAAERFATDVVVVDSGADQRSARWDQPLMEYDIAYGVRTIEQLQRLKIFFRTMRGRLYSFLFYDPLDHTSETINAAIDYTLDFPKSPLDQYIGSGTGWLKTFQLQKTYSSPSGDLTNVRPITKPIENTTVIAVDGVEVHNFTVDKMTGIVTFTPRVTLSNLQDMSLSVVGSAITISSPTAIFQDFVGTDKIIMSGWANGVNNTTESMRLQITEISLDKKSITCGTDLTTWQPEMMRDGVTISTHPAPLNTAIITAGFEFYVPVRFDTDRLPVALSEYGEGAAADVKLIEVRPQEL